MEQGWKRDGRGMEEGGGRRQGWRQGWRQGGGREEAGRRQGGGKAGRREEAGRQEGERGKETDLGCSKILERIPSSMVYL
eukprot:763552-Hanusia_phi.AAC.1